MVDRAIDRGEVPAGTESRPALELLVAPLLFRVLATGEPLTKRLADRLADSVVRVVRPA
jgi:hypothetical protein